MEVNPQITDAVTQSLKETDAASAAVQKTEFRVTLDSITEKVVEVEYHNPTVCPHMTVAFVKMENGFIVTGESAPADAANFDADLGRKFAFENAVRKIWTLEGYLLRDYLHFVENAEISVDGVEVEA